MRNLKSTMLDPNPRRIGERVRLTEEFYKYWPRAQRRTTTGTVVGIVGSAVRVAWDGRKGVEPYHWRYTDVET